MNYAQNFMTLKKSDIKFKSLYKYFQKRFFSIFRQMQRDQYNSIYK